MRRTQGMQRVLPLAVVAALVACGPEPLTPEQQAAKDRGDCHVAAVDQTGFDPASAEEPVRTISHSERAGGEVVGSGAIARGAAGGALVGVVGGAIAGDVGTGAAVGAATGGLFGGLKRKQETDRMVTRTRPNPAYQEYAQNKQAYKTALEHCMASRGYLVK